LGYQIATQTKSDNPKIVAATSLVVEVISFWILDYVICMRKGKLVKALRHGTVEIYQTDPFLWSVMVIYI
jgi:hypothetical protein